MEKKDSISRKFITTVSAGMVYRHHSLDCMGINFNRINHLNKGLVLLIICHLCCFSKINAGSYVHAKNNVTFNEKVTTFRTIGYPANFLFNFDTVPKHGWEVLFDGKNTGKLRGINSDTFPSNGWAVEGGTLSVKNNKKGEDIITREVYYNFELAFDFKLTYAANSGIKYFVEKIKNNNSGEMVWNGPEYQIIDDENNPDLKAHEDPKASTAALYLIYAPKNKKLQPPGQWNRAKIIVRGNLVEHWLNGVKVVSYERGTGDFRRRMAATKFKDYDNYGELPGGHIMITDHDGDKVYFRNIRIKQFR